jgi:ATP-binding cassette, sub-family E, member 1
MMFYYDVIDYICCLYGTPSAYGVVTMPFSVREGINIFLAGFIPTENLRFRDEELNFKMATTTELYENPGRSNMYHYPNMTKTMKSSAGAVLADTPAAAASAAAAADGGDSNMTANGTARQFVLHVEEGSFTDSEIIVMLGENGTGKTTFIRMMAGLLKSDEAAAAEEAGDHDLAATLGVPHLNVSYKPQKISPKFQGTVRQLLHKRIRDAYVHPMFVSDVMRPMSMDSIMDNGVQDLSGGELQRVAIVLALGMPADIYLIDEPSAYLDSEQRIAASKVIKRFIMHAKKTAFVVEHDFIMATYLADRVVVYDGVPGVETCAHSPQALIPGMNTFLSQLNITFRRDPSNFRPRINKVDSIKDREQKLAGNYFYLDDTD